MASFSSAFAKARKAGKLEFTWRGKRYHTRIKGEKALPRKGPVPKTRPKTDDVKTASVPRKAAKKTKRISKTSKIPIPKSRPVPVPKERPVSIAVRRTGERLSGRTSEGIGWFKKMRDRFNKRKGVRKGRNARSNR